MTHKKILSGTLFGLALVLSSPAWSVTMTFTDSTAFFAALGGAPVTTVDFEGVATPTTVSSGGSVGDITFTYNYGPSDMTISSGFGTTSGTNYLAVDDTTFESGDTFDMSFGDTMQAIGLFVIGEDMLAGDVELSAGAASIFNSTAEFSLVDGDVFFLGLIDTNGFTTATLNSFDPLNEGLFVFNIDDISHASAVPLPMSAWLLGSGLVALVGFRRSKEA